MERILRCIVIDDEPLARELLKSYCERTPGLKMENCFESAAEAVKTVMSDSIDLVFLDINMPLLNGVEFARLIPPTTRIIFVTAYANYALEGFRLNALDYLLKPVSYQEFLQSVGKAMEWFAMRASVKDTRTEQETGNTDTIIVKSDYKLLQLRMDSIQYIEVRKDRLIFVRNNGEDISVVMSMREVEKILPPATFMRVHRSFIVNLKNVEVIDRNRIVFGKTYIPVSDSHKEEFLRRVGASGLK